MKLTRSAAKQRGTMMLELALLLPVLILILMLVLEGSQLVRTHVVLNNAAREGVRLSVMPENQGSTKIADIRAAVVAYAAQNNVTITDPDTNVVINQSVSVAMPAGYAAMTASQVTVNCTYTLNYLAVFTWLGVPSTYTLQGSALFRNFY